MNIDEEKFDFVINQLDPNYKGYSMQQILSVEVGLILIEKDVFRLKSIFKIFYQYSFDKMRINAKNFFVLGKHGRKDYKEIVDYVTDQLEVDTWKLLDFNKVKISLYLSLSPIFQFVKLSVKLKGIVFKKRLHLASKIVFYQNSINNLERHLSISSNCKHVVLFSSVHPWEAMVLNYCSKRNIESISLQHGVYFIYKETIPIDYVLYKNFNADKHLCWGEYSKNQFATYGINENQLIVAGYPRTFKEYGKNIEEGFNSVVLLARKVLHESNINLFNVLQEFIKKNSSYKFYIKPHPSLLIEDFNSYVDNKNIFIIEGKETIQDIFTSGKFSSAICVYTTAYYEAYLNGIMGLRFYDGRSELSEGILMDIFSNAEELQRILKEQIPAKEEIDIKLNYIMGHQINNYRTILEN